MLVLRGRHVTDRAPRLRLNLGSRFMSLKFRVQMSSSCYIDLVFSNWILPPAGEGFSALLQQQQFVFHPEDLICPQVFSRSPKPFEMPLLEVHAPRVFQRGFHLMESSQSTPPGNNEDVEQEHPKSASGWDS